MPLEPFLGEVWFTPYDRVVRNSALCSGSVIPVSQNTALYSLLSTHFPGQIFPGQSFALPNLVGGTPVGQPSSSSGLDSNVGQSNPVSTTVSAGVAYAGTVTMTPLISLEGFFPIRSGG